MSHRHQKSLPVDRSAFAGYRFPPEEIMPAVRWYLRYGRSYRDVVRPLERAEDESSLYSPLIGPFGKRSEEGSVLPTVGVREQFAPLADMGWGTCVRLGGDG